MKKQRLFLLLFFLFLVGKSSSQSFLITQPKLEFNGNKLLISYDVINKNAGNQFYVWVEMEKKNGEQIHMKTISGDIGDKIKGGKNKKITWIPEKDSVFLNEEVFVEIKAEKYIKSFNKGSAMLMSTVMPGLGQSKLGKGKPWWLTGVAAYGALAGGIIIHKNYIKTYDSYRTEEDPSKRTDLLTKAQNQMNTSGALILSAAALWAANIFWVAITPNEYQPLKHVQLSFDQLTGSDKRTTLLTLRFSF